MPKQHSVKAGECVSSIAYQYGFFADTVWNDPANASLKAQRKNMNTLIPGDTLTIPDKREKEEPRTTGASHRFQRRGVPAKLRLTVKRGDEVRANEPYEIEIDGRTTRGTTGPNGEITVSISPAAKRGRLVVGLGEDQDTFELRLGHLQPVEEVEGVQARLNNLGFSCGREFGSVGPATRIAISAFQQKHGLPVTGEIDDALRSRLVEIHDTHS